MTPSITGIAAPPRFTRFELAYLLAGRDDTSSLISREVFGIPDVGDAGASARAGAASLVARGLIEERQGSVLPRNEAGLVGFSLGTAQEWISLVLRVPEGEDLVVFVQGIGVAFMVRGAPAATLDFVPTEPGVSAREVAQDAITRLLGRDDLDLVLRIASARSRRSLYLQARSGVLGIGLRPVFPLDANWPSPDLEIVAASHDEVVLAVNAFLYPDSPDVSAPATR
jgi:hypothetical protein